MKKQKSRQNRIHKDHVARTRMTKDDRKEHLDQQLEHEERLAGNLVEGI